MSDKVVPGLDIDDIVALIDREIGDPILPRPDGFGITVKEYAEKKGCGDDIARKMLEKAVKSGLLEKKQMVNGTGTTPFIYYKPDV